MFEVFKKKNGKRLFWGQNRKLGYDDFTKGEKLVFKLSQKILAPDIALAKKVTKQVMQEWQSCIQDQTRRRSNTQQIRSPWGPDKIYLNQFHLLQNHAFKLLEDAELDQESRLKENAELSVAIHPWTLILRYVKAVLLRTEQNSIRRLIGMGGVLREYTPVEIQEIFTALWSISEDFANKGHAPYRDRDSVYYSQRIIEIFSERINRLSLNERFEPHATNIYHGKVSHKFEPLNDNHEVLDWIDDILCDELCPWGVERISPQTARNENKSKRFLDLTVLAIEPVLQSKNLDEFCAVDEKRMRVVTEPTQFSYLCRQVFDVKEEEMKKMSLPNLFGADSTRTPPDPPNRATLKKDELWNEHQKTVAFRQRGWQAESLFIGVDENEPTKHFLDRKRQFNLSIPETARTVEVYLANENDKIFFYRLHLNWIPQPIADGWDEEFTAEGGQTIAFHLTPAFENDRVSDIHLTIKYREPAYWYFFRTFCNIARYRKNYRFHVIAGSTVIVAAALLILAVFFAPQIFYNSSPHEKEERATVIIDEKQNPANSNSSDQIAVLPNVQANNEIDKSANSNKSDSSITAQSNNRQEKNEPENKHKSNRGRKILEPKQTPYRERIAKNGRNEQEKRAIEIFGDPQNIKREAGIIDQSSTSRSASPTSGKFLISPNETYVRPKEILLTWSPVPSATGYFIEIRNSAGSVIIEQFYTKANAAQINQLPAGGNYFWVVIPTNSKNVIVTPALEGNFSTLPTAAMERVTAAENQYSNAPLLLGIVYMKNGLSEEALSKFREYSAQNPKSKLVQKLIKRVIENRPR